MRWLHFDSLFSVVCGVEVFLFCLLQKLLVLLCAVKFETFQPKMEQAELTTVAMSSGIVLCDGCTMRGLPWFRFQHLFEVIPNQGHEPIATTFTNFGRHTLRWIVLAFFLRNQSVIVDTKQVTKGFHTQFAMSRCLNDLPTPHFFALTFSFTRFRNQVAHQNWVASVTVRCTLNCFEIVRSRTLLRSNVID